MDALLKKRLANLLTIKSIVTLVLTLVFAYMALTKIVGAEFYQNVYLMVVSFYFGTQVEKASSKNEEPAA